MLGNETLDYFRFAIGPENIDPPARPGIFPRHESWSLLGHPWNMRLWRPGSSQLSCHNQTDPLPKGRSWLTGLTMRLTEEDRRQSTIDLASWLGSLGRLGSTVIQSLRQFQPLLATLGDAVSDCSHDVFCLALREVFEGRPCELDSAGALDVHFCYFERLYRHSLFYHLPRDKTGEHRCHNQTDPLPPLALKKISMVPARRGHFFFPKTGALALSVSQPKKS